MLFDPHLPPRFVVENTHDGLLLDFPRRPPTGCTVGFAMFGWLVVGWLTLWALALPWADLVESMRWWDVNREILQFRWMTIGMPLWPFVFTGLWLWARGPAKLRVKVDQHAIRWRGRLGWRRVVWSELDDVSIRPRHLALTTRRGRVHLLPALPGPVLRQLHRFVRALWGAANPGDDAEVPAELRELVRQRRQAAEAQPTAR